MEKGLKRWIKELTEDVDGKLHLQLANLCFFCIHVRSWKFSPGETFTSFVTCLLSLVKFLSHEYFCRSHRRYIVHVSTFTALTTIYSISL
jgi:hypothetical protein